MSSQTEARNYRDDSHEGLPESSDFTIQFDRIAAFESAVAEKSESPEEEIESIIKELLDDTKPGKGSYIDLEESGEVPEWNSSPPRSGSSHIRIALDRARFIHAWKLYANEPRNEEDFKDCAASTIEFRQVEIDEDTFIIVSVGLWGYQPESPFSFPPPCPSINHRIIEDPATMLESMSVLANHLAVELAGKCGIPRTFSLDSEPMRQPTFYLLIPPKEFRPTEPDDWIGPSRQSCVSKLANDLLGVPDVKGQRVSACVSLRQMLILNRRGSGNFSTFILLPSRSFDVPEIESDCQAIRRSFEGFDAELSYLQWDVKSDLQRYFDRIADFGWIYTGAAGVLHPLLRELDDSEPSQLPRGIKSISRRRILRKQRWSRQKLIRDSIESIRTTLLQGDPDIIYLRREIHRIENDLAMARRRVDENKQEQNLRQVEGMQHTLDGLTRPLEAMQAQASSALEAISREASQLTNSASAVLADRREESLAALSRIGYYFNILVLIPDSRHRI